MTQQTYEKELELYIEMNFDGGIEYFKTNYIDAKNKVFNHMSFFLKKCYHGDREKLKNINDENSKRLNNWLEKNNLVPTIYS